LRTIELFVKKAKLEFKPVNFAKKKDEFRKSCIVGTEVDVKLNFASKWCLRRFGPHY